MRQNVLKDKWEKEELGMLATAREDGKLERVTEGRFLYQIRLKRRRFGTYPTVFLKATALFLNLHIIKFL